VFRNPLTKKSMSSTKWHRFSPQWQTMLPNRHLVILFWLSSLTMNAPTNLPETLLRDKFDRELIALLQANARESTANLARRLGVARTTVVARLAKLEANGLIGGYSVRLGGEAVARGIQAFVGIVVQPKAGREVIRELTKFPELLQLASVSGEFDYMATLRADNTARLDVLLDQIGEIEGVTRTNTSVILALRIDRGG
jgi:DNA-binding Lrp family transcriptional regulator